MRVLVFAGGDPISPQRIRELGSVDLIIAADSGAEAAVAARLNVDVLVGDLDSISPATLENVHNLGTAIEAHAPDKDATDLELAILSAQDRGATAVTVVGGGGGRLDHLLGNVAVVASPRFRMVQVTWVLAEETSYPVHRDRQIAVEPGTTLSLIAIGGDAHGVTLSGVRWPLEDATLASDASLGISNVATEPTVDVHVDTGTLLVVANH